jgi:hypothetical protein
MAVATEDLGTAGTISKSTSISTAVTIITSAYLFVNNSSSLNVEKIVSVSVVVMREVTSCWDCRSFADHRMQNFTTAMSWTSVIKWMHVNQLWLPVGPVHKL